jgi:hypothetical protein
MRPEWVIGGDHEDTAIAGEVQRDVDVIARLCFVGRWFGLSVTGGCG